MTTGFTKLISLRLDTTSSNSPIQRHKKHYLKMIKMPLFFSLNKCWEFSEHFKKHFPTEQREKRGNDCIVHRFNFRCRANGQWIIPSGKKAPSCPLGKPITTQDLTHLARSWSQPYNNMKELLTGSL